MVRPARPDEVPKFGQVWTLGPGGRPLMAVCEDTSMRAGETWLFVRLDRGSRESATVRLFWSTMRNKREPLPDWYLIDE